MYGYIRFYRDELKMKDYDLFKAYYCGLCRELGKRFGPRGRMLLSYDMTFMALFLDGLQGDPIDKDRGFCPISPLRKKPMVTTTEGIKKAAQLSLLMGFHKLEDAKADKEHMFVGTAVTLYKGAYRKSKKDDPMLTESVGKQLKTFYQGEKNPNIELDFLVDPFASLVSDIMSENASEEYKKTLAKMGYHAGRWLYFIDALDDLPNDVKKGQFNAFCATLPYPKNNWQEFYKAARDDINANLFVSLEELTKEFKTLPLTENRELIENIFFLGIRGVTEVILALRDQGNEKKFAQPFAIRTSCRHDAVTDK